VVWRASRLTELSRYGKVLRTYKGQGNLQLKAKGSFECSFEAVQLVDGAIRAQCDFLNKNLSQLNSLVAHLMDGVEIQSMTGFTQDDQEVKLGGHIQFTSINYPTSTDSQAVIITLLASEMSVYPKGERNQLTTLRFGITNFEFEGNVVREQKVKNHHKFDRGILSATLSFGEIRIEKLSNYEEVIANLRATQGIEPTAEILLELHQSHGIEWAENVAAKLCTILSLAKGTKIAWIYLDGYDTAGLKYFTIHKYAVTRPYAGVSASIIDSVNPNDVKELLEKGYDRLERGDKEYMLTRAIDSYLEAKRPHSYLESKALAAIQAMELLVGKYAERHDSIFIIGEDEFKERLVEIGAGIRNVLKKAFEEKYTIALCGEQNEKFKSLNRYTLRQVLKRLLKDFGVQISGQKLHDLMETRNALVHKGSFHTNNAVKEYYRVISSMDRIFLRMLGYEGHILDCEQKWVRVKL
jgi:hypothetical protein